MNLKPGDDECCKCSESLRPVIPEGHLLGGPPLSDVKHPKADPEAGEVTEHVGGVTHDGQAARHPAPHQLASHEQTAQDCRHRQLLPSLKCILSFTYSFTYPDEIK